MTNGNVIAQETLPMILIGALVHEHSPRTEQDFDQVIPGFELADEHAFGSREKLGRAHGNGARPVVDNLVCVVRESTLQTFLDDLPWIFGGAERQNQV